MQQRTIHTTNKPSSQPGGIVRVGALGITHEVAPGKTVAETLAELGLTPQSHQSVRVGTEEVTDIRSRVLDAGESLVVVNRVVGG
jgi:sulfur carrier protein ThiS